MSESAATNAIAVYVLNTVLHTARHDATDLDQLISILTDMRDKLLNVEQENEKPKNKKKSSSSSKTDSASKRQPTFYNLFVKECIPAYPDISPAERFKAIAELWKTSEHGEFIKTKCAELKAEMPDMLNVDIYDIAAAEWNQRYIHIGHVDNEEEENNSDNESDN